MSKKPLNHIYDYAVVGAGLSGLLISAALSKDSDNIVLLEADEEVGGFNKAIQTERGLTNNGIRFFPRTESSIKSLDFLESILSLKVGGSEIECLPITFESGQLKTFLGFGDNPPEFYEELSYFVHSHLIELKLQPHEWPKLLFEKFRGDFMPRSYVTKFHQNDKNEITHLTVNGSKTVQAKKFIFCGSLKDLAVLLPTDALSAKARNKLNKETYWTALCLDLTHSTTVSDTQAMHILNGTTKDEIGPCAGQFLSAKSESSDESKKSSQVSQWITFIDEEVTEDSEVVAQTLKKIKKQIKRAYPTAMDGLLNERIVVVPAVSGDGNLKLNANQSIPSTPNLWIACGAVATDKNLIGCLLQVENVLQQLY